MAAAPVTKWLAGWLASWLAGWHLLGEKSPHFIAGLAPVPQCLLLGSVALLHWEQVLSWRACLRCLQGFTPCELFQRIRGRTLWLLGDSQTWNFYYAVECFLREFAPSLRRS